MSREELDRRMHKAFIALSFCANASAAQLGPKASGLKAGTSAPMGDGSLFVYRKRYELADCDETRLAVIVDIEGEVELMQPRKPGDVLGESDEEYRRRVVSETAGSTPEEVSTSRYAVSVSVIKQWRKLEGVSPVDGKPRRDLSKEQQVSEAIRLKEMGRSVYEIHKVLDVHREQVARWVSGDRRKKAA